MRKERIDQNKIRFILNRQDLAERNINTKELKYGTPEAKSLFDELISMAREELGLGSGIHPMMVEAIPMGESGLVVNISKVENPDELDPRFSRFSNGIDMDRMEQGPGSVEGPVPDFRDDAAMGGPGYEPQSGGPGGEPSDEEESPEGPGSFTPDGEMNAGPGGPYEGEEENPDGPPPDGIQIQQGPEIRAEINIPGSSAIDPGELMNVIDNIMSGIAGKIDESIKRGKEKKAGPTPPQTPSRENKGASPESAAVYEFRELQSVIRAAKLLAPNYHSESILYKNPLNRKYYLYIGTEHNTPQEFQNALAILNEFGMRCRINYSTKAFFEEHMEKILVDALTHLSELG